MLGAAHGCGRARAVCVCVGCRPCSARRAVIIGRARGERAGGRQRAAEPPHIWAARRWRLPGAWAAPRVALTAKSAAHCFSSRCAHKARGEVRARSGRSKGCHKLLSMMRRCAARLLVLESGVYGVSEAGQKQAADFSGTSAVP